MQRRRARPMIGISLGDFTGIGPEVALKALAAESPGGCQKYLLLGDMAQTRRLNEQLGLGLSLERWQGSAGSGRIFMDDPRVEPLPDGLTAGSPLAAGAALDYLREGAHRCLRQELDALVTAPVNKESILRRGLPFVGQTEFLSSEAGTPETAMMLLGQDDRNRWLRVALVTTHFPLKLVAAQLTAKKIEEVIHLGARACRDLELPRRRLAVCGLNPHAGEGGELGTEELAVIAPAIRAAREKGVDVCGPLAADTLFFQAYRGDYELVVAMYHDQGLVPLKMVAFETGVNWTLGLPFIRTSPDHGTAYDIAGKNRANPASMRAAIGLARRLLQNRARTS